MYVLGIDRELPAGLRDRLRGELARRGTLGIVDLTRGRAGDTPARVAIRASLSDSGEWHITGEDGSPDQLLDELAPRCSHALVLGLGESEWPTLHINDGTVSGTLIPDATPVDDLEVPELVDALEASVPWETLESLVARAKQSPRADLAGAIATFTGRVRAKESPDDTPTESLEFERYDPIAGEKLDRLRSELLERTGVHEVLLHHRVGLVPAGEDIVFVVVLAGHREEAFRTVEDGINRLKAEVPIFKKELMEDQEFWVHNRP